MNLALGEALAKAGIRGTKAFEHIERDVAREEQRAQEKSKQRNMATRVASRELKKPAVVPAPSMDAAEATLKRLDAAEAAPKAPENPYDRMWGSERSHRFVAHLLHAFVPYSRAVEAAKQEACSVCRKPPKAGAKHLGNVESRSQFCPECWEEFKKWASAHPDALKNTPKKDGQ